MPNADRQLCDYAVKLTLMPGCVDESDIVQLKEAGFSEQQITIAVQVIGYFNYINRVADGLGVESEDWMTIDRDEWLKNKANFRTPG